MGTLRRWTLNQYADGTALTSAIADDSGSQTSGNNVIGTGAVGTVSSDHPHSSPVGWKFVATSGNQAYQRYPLPATNTSFAFDFWFYNPHSGSTGPTATEIIIGPRNSTPAYAGRIKITTGNKLAFDNFASTTIWTSASTLPTGLIRVSGYLTRGTTTSNGLAVISYFTDNTAVPIETYAPGATINLGTADYANFDIGRLSTSAYTYTVYVDDLTFEDGRTSIIDPATIGNVKNTVSLTAEGNIGSRAPKRWTGAGLTAGTSLSNGNVNTAGNGDTVGSFINSGTFTSVMASDGVTFTGAASSSAYINISGLSGFQFAGQLFYTPLETPAASANSTIISARNSGSFIMQMIHNSAGNFLVQNTSSVTVSGSTSASALVVNHEYEIDFAFLIGTSSSNGRLIYRIKDMTDQTWNTTGQFFFDSDDTQNFGTTELSAIRMGKSATTVLSTGMKIRRLGWETYIPITAGMDATEAKKSFMVSPFDDFTDATVAETVTISATGALTTLVATASVAETVTISATGSVTVPSFNGTASVAETVSISSTGLTSSTASVAETLTIAATGTVTNTASVSESVTITATGALFFTKSGGSVDEIISITATGNTIVSAVGNTVASTITRGATGAGAGSGTRSETISITASGVNTVSGSGSVSETTSISSTGLTSGTAAVSETVSRTATGSVSAATSQTETITITATGLVNSSASGGTVAETISRTGSGTTSGTGSVSETISITSAGTVSATGSGSVSETVSITATGLATGSGLGGNVGSTVSITATGNLSTSNTATVAETTTISASGVVNLSETAQRSSTVNLTASGFTSLSGGNIAETISISASGTIGATVNQASTIIGTVSGTASATGNRSETVTISATGMLGVTVNQNIAANLTADGSISGNGISNRLANANLSATGTTSGGSNNIDSAITLSATGQLTLMLTGSGSRASSISISAASNLNASGTSPTQSIQTTITASGMLLNNSDNHLIIALNAAGIVSNTATRTETVSISASGQLGLSKSGNSVTNLTLTASGQLGFVNNAARNETISITASGLINFATNGSRNTNVTITARGRIVGANIGPTIWDGTQEIATSLFIWDGTQEIPASYSVA